MRVIISRFSARVDRSCLANLSTGSADMAPANAWARIRSRSASVAAAFNEASARRSYRPT